MRLLSFSKHIHRETRCSSSYFSRKKRKKKNKRSRDTYTRSAQLDTRFFRVCPISYRVCTSNGVVHSRHVSQGPCCTSGCTLRNGDKCRDDNGCRDASFCDGRSPQCPPSINKPNKTICNEEYVCYMGVSVHASCTVLLLHVIPFPSSCEFPPPSSATTTGQVGTRCTKPSFHGKRFPFLRINSVNFPLPDFRSWLMIKFEIFNNQTN